MAGKRYIVLYDFTAESPNELSCRAGDEVISNSEESDGWIHVKFATRVSSQRSVNGLVPVSYLQLKPSSPTRRPAPPPPTSGVGSNSPASASRSTQGMPSSPPKSNMQRTGPADEKCYKLLYKFVASDSDEISCSPGDLVVAVGPPINGRIKVRKLNQAPGPGGVTGFVPFSYLSEQPGPSSHYSSFTPSQVVPPPPTSCRNIAVEHAECAICYDEMISRPIAILLGANKKRSCRHFLHKDCAEGLLRVNQKKCPICRAPFMSIYPMPSFDSNPKLWFECVDANGNGTLSKAEVVEVLKATMDIDYRALEKNVDYLWPRWDTDGSGEIDFQELCDPKVGLLVYCRSHMARKKRDPPPKLTLSNLEIWYQYWDEDDNGCLNKEEIIRALVKTFNLSTTPSKINELRENVNMVWSVFDVDNSGEVDLKEFVMRDGLGESLCASLSFFNSS